MVGPHWPQKLPGNMWDLSSAPSLNYIWPSLLGTVNWGKLFCDSTALTLGHCLTSRLVSHLHPQPSQILFLSLIMHVELLHRWPQLSSNFADLRVSFAQSLVLAFPIVVFIFNHFHYSSFSNVTNCLFRTFCLWLKYVIYIIFSSLLFTSACFLLLSEYLTIILVHKNQTSSWG